MQFPSTTAIKPAKSNTEFTANYNKTKLSPATTTDFGLSNTSYTKTLHTKTSSASSSKNDEHELSRESALISHKEEEEEDTPGGYVPPAATDSPPSCNYRFTDTFLEYDTEDSAYCISCNDNNTAHTKDSNGSIGFVYNPNVKFTNQLKFANTYSKRGYDEYDKWGEGF